jgi:hypothetical protein
MDKKQTITDITYYIWEYPNREKKYDAGWKWRCGDIMVWDYIQSDTLEEAKDYIWHHGCFRADEIEVKIWK